MTGLMMKKNEKTDFEIRFFERIISERPLYIEALIPLAEAYTRSGNYQKGLEIDRKLSELCHDDPTAFYNLACSYALMSQSVEAFNALETAIDLGYRDWMHMIQDRDLKSLHSDERFKKALEKIKAGITRKPKKVKGTQK